jgi:outer membrane protein assembly factor BamB
MRHRLIGVAALALLAMTACGPTHTDPRWASISKIAGGQQILLAFGDRLSLIDTADGKPVELTDSNGDVRLDDQGNARVWEVKGTSGQTRFYTSPVILDPETLLTSSYDNHLYEVDFPVARLDGDSAAFDQHIVAAPVVDGDMVYQGLGDRDFVALNLDGLSEVWRVPTSYGIWAEPLIVGDTLYFTSLDHNLYAVDKATGEVKWKTDLQGAITSTPVYQDGHLYVGSFARKLFDVDADTGAINAEFPVSEWIWNAPALVDGTLYAGDLSGKVYSINPGSMTANWETQAATKGIGPTPLVTENFVIVGSRDHNLYWLNRETGEVTDSKALAGEVLANLLLVEPGEGVDIPEPLVIVSTAAPQELLVAFTLDRGQRVWAYGR